MCDSWSSQKHQDYNITHYDEYKPQGILLLPIYRTKFSISFLDETRFGAG